MAIEEKRMRFTVERYERMVELGVLTEDDRVELVGGEILEMSPPPRPPHASVVDRLTRLFYRTVGDHAHIRVQNPVLLPPDSEWEPDLALTERHAHDYSARHPEPSDLLLVIEVVHTTHRRDRRKFAEYARKGVREAWFVDVRDERIEVHRGPSPDGYTSVEIAGRGERVSAEAFPDATFAVDEILG